MTHTKKYDLAIYIGRFQPFHLGHAHAVQQGLNIADDVLILISSTGGPRGMKNPFTPTERRRMIESSMGANKDDGHIFTDEIYDRGTDADWVAQVHDVVKESFPGNLRVVLIGHDKDASSYYLKLFPQWDFIDTGYEDIASGKFAVDATHIRATLYQDAPYYVRGLLDPSVFEQISGLMKYDWFKELSEEYKFVKAYKESWASAPFPPTFITTDAMVVSGGHVLLIERGQNPGKGLLALPGGFLDQVKTIENCALRELFEETNIHLQEDTLRRCIKHVKVFDRAGGVGSEDRGRIVTHVHLIELDPTKPLPKVKGGDDAATADWYLLSELHPQQFFSDHYKIIQSLVGYLK